MTRQYKRTNVNILLNILLQLTIVLGAFTKKTVSLYKNEISVQFRSCLNVRSWRYSESTMDYDKNCYTRNRAMT